MASLILSIIRFFVGISGFAYSFIILHNSEKRSTSRYFGFAEFFMGLWMTISGFQEAYSNILIENPYILSIIIGIQYIITEFAVISILYFSINFGKILNLRKKVNSLTLYLIPIILIIVFACSHIFYNISPFFNTDINQAKFITDNNKNAGSFLFHKKNLYYFHCYLCYCLLGITIILLILRTITNFKEYKRLLMLFAVGVFAFSLQNFNIFIKENFFSYLKEINSYNIETLCAFFMMTASFLVFYFDERQQSIILCKKQLFNYSNTPIFIFGKDNKLIETSYAANELLSYYHIFVKKFDNFDKVFPIEKVQQLGIQNLENEKHASYFSFSSDKKLFYARKIPISSMGQKIKSYYLIFSRMDFYAESVRQLEQAAFTDAVSGFKKRGSLLQQIFNDISMHSMSICLIVMSINNYEIIMEDNGLTNGNKIVSQFCKMLKDSITETDLIYRISDSTFAFILPITMTKKLPQLFAKIKKDCKNFSKDNDFSVSIGYTVSTNKDANSIDEFIEKGYQNMLLDRKKAIPEPLKL